jgi:hypothetical protein
VVAATGGTPVATLGVRGQGEKVQNFGFDTFLSTLLPGVIASFAVFMFIQTFLPDAVFFKWLVSSQSQELLFTSLVLIFSTLFGSILSSFLDFFEWKFMDNRAAKKLEISRDEYNNQWYRYLSSLSSANNPYISGKALMLRFELRTALALVLLGSALVFSPGYCVAALLTFVFSGVMYYLSCETHYLLAHWRDREYGEGGDSSEQAAS